MKDSTKPTRVTPTQKQAYRRLMARDGWKNVSAADAKALATYRHLTSTQREYFAAWAARNAA